MIFFFQTMDSEDFDTCTEKKGSSVSQLLDKDYFEEIVQPNNGIIAC